MRSPSPWYVVFTAWVVMSAAAVGFVLVHGTNLPVVDEWGMVRALATSRPDSSWLLERHNEHFLPLPRLIFWGVFRLTGDLRAGMLISVAGWSVLAILLADAARTVRGRAAYSDAVFPVYLLNWSQYENLLMSYQLGFMCSSVLAGLTLRAIALGSPNQSRVFQVGVFAALLPLCGGHGLVFAAPGVVWLTAVAVAHRANPVRAGSAAALALGVVAIVFRYAWTSPTPAPPGLPPLTGYTVLCGTLGFLATGYGLVGWNLWPWSAVVPGGTTVAGWWTLYRTWMARQPSERVRLIGLTAFSCATFVLALGIACTRGRYGLFGVFFSRYTVISALAPITAYFIWLVFGSPRVARLGPAVLAAVGAATLPINSLFGWSAGERIADIQRSVEEDLLNGVPVETVGERTNFLVFNNPAAWAGFVEEYARLRLGKLDSVRHLPPVVIEQVGGEQLTECPDGWMRLTFSKPKSVSAVRVRVRYDDPLGFRPARFQSAWRGEAGGPETFRDDWLCRSPSGGFGDPSMVVWVDGALAEFRFRPDADRPGRPTVTSVELLTPVAGAGGFKSTASTGTSPARLGP